MAPPEDIRHATYAQYDNFCGPTTPLANGPALPMPTVPMSYSFTTPPPSPSTDCVSVVNTNRSYLNLNSLMEYRRPI